MTFERELFLRPTAHRGLHDAASGIIENTAEAFEAAIAGDFGIECDLRPARNGHPIVFHDLTLDRLVDASGPTSAWSLPDLKRLRYRGCNASILTFSEFLELVGGRVPLLVEIKSEWDPPDFVFLEQIADQSRAYRGPLALMSFDPHVMTVMRRLAPKVPRGIVAGGYRVERDDDWWQDKLDWRERFLLRHLLRSVPAGPSFFNYHVKSLPTAATTVARKMLDIPLFAWTVRTEADRATASRHADAIVFEGFVPPKQG